jgi:hypothetical protein
MTIFYLMLKATPTANHEDFDDIGGAFINYWIKAEDEESAKSNAIKNLKDICWNVIRIEDCFQVSEEFYKDNPESLEDYKQAIIYGEYFVTNEWPNEPQEDDLIH